MKDLELINLWKAYDEKLDKVLSINKEIVFNLTKEKVSSTLGKMRIPKTIMLLLGIPYTLLLYAVTIIGYHAGGVFVTLGFGCISLIMTLTIIGYFYHLYLINSVNRFLDIIEVQKKIAKLKISSFNMVRLAIIQIPFWSICWVSLDALKESPFIYGGVHLIVLLGFIYLSYWLYKSLHSQKPHSKVRQFFLSGVEWEPITKASEILAQLKDLEDPS
ncbi:hypothetical protein [Ascidiimonas sp. W6]|uniref:hypothetical protein n=1 Tax=Ascidiimonas meishanensis TaxID=3128903 RepID=UPI0030EEF435